MIWDEQQQSGYGIISVKDTEGGFRNFAYEIPGEVHLPDTLGDLYFAPNLFSRPKRRKEFVLPSWWLYADLDAIDPNVINPRPTVAWQSSPGRFQCLWLGNRILHPQEHGELNKRLTYYIKADKGGWDATQVLRIPGTRNYKYPSKPKVKLLWTE